MSITRRDFLNGAAISIAAGMTPVQLLQAATQESYYPPALSGLRGSHAGAFDVAHQLGWEKKVFNVEGLKVEEDYDLVVVGAGISGLAAAWFYREKHPQARILLLDNHDDFGGHAKRNEFSAGGRMILGYGGSESLDSPKRHFSAQVYRLLDQLGVKLRRFDKAFLADLYDDLGLSSGVFFDRQTFGTDRLVSGQPDYEDEQPDWSGFIARFPLNDAERAALLTLYEDERDYLPEMAADGKQQYLGTLSYRDFLLKHVRLSARATAYFQQRSSDEYGYTIEFMAASDAYLAGYPGFAGMGLSGADEMADEPYIYHFPDGNASVARLLVRGLIPLVAAGSGMDDIVLAQFDYGKLDLAGAPVRLRLNSTAVSVQNRAGGVDVGYSTAGQLHRVRGKHCVLACYNMMIPYLLRDLPVAQAQALSQNVKLPLVYANVLIRNWQSLVKLGVQDIYSPAMPFAQVKLDYPVDLGGYLAPRDPAKPVCLHMVQVPHVDGVGPDLRSQARAARGVIYATSFGQYEAAIRDQLQRMLGAGGFEQRRDILAITVNRWPHGYSYYSNPLFDGEDGGAAVMQLARKPLGQVTIANSDSGWDPYLHGAVDQAWRAVTELG
ncbi:MAG: NAD(P)-binding protein [Pseudomonas sp.]|nr:NAD(P)-binding protein [Pseudomonas sp.]